MSNDKEPVSKQILDETKNISKRLGVLEKAVEGLTSVMTQISDSNTKTRVRYHKYEGKLPESYEGEVATFRRTEDDNGNETFSLIVPVGLLEEDGWFKDHAAKILVPTRLKDGSVVLNAVDKDVDRSKEFTSQGGETEGLVCVFINDYLRVKNGVGEIVRMKFVRVFEDDPELDAPF